MRPSIQRYLVFIVLLIFVFSLMFYQLATLQLFQGADILGYEPKTHSTGVQLHLVLSFKGGETVTIDLSYLKKSLKSLTVQISLIRTPM